MPYYVLKLMGWAYKTFLNIREGFESITLMGLLNTVSFFDKRQGSEAMTLMGLPNRCPS